MYIWQTNMSAALIFCSNPCSSQKKAHRQHKEHQQRVVRIQKYLQTEVSGFYFCLHLIHNCGEHCQLMNAPSSLHDSI